VFNLFSCWFWNAPATHRLIPPIFYGLFASFVHLHNSR
jgi:hypothetical protein